jgi:hypothetical protein
MRIFRSIVGDPMLLDSPDGLLTFHAAITEFLASSLSSVSYKANTTGSPAPYSNFLLGLRIKKHETSSLQYSDDGWLELSGTLIHLNELLECFFDVNDGEHKHWYSNPVSLIVEADSTWPR